MSASEATPNASPAVQANASPSNGGSTPLTPIQFQLQWLEGMVESVEDAGGLTDRSHYDAGGLTTRTMFDDTRETSARARYSSPLIARCHRSSRSPERASRDASHLNAS